MFCKNCGKELEENAVFCDACGVKVENDSAATEECVAENSAEVKEEVVSEPVTAFEEPNFDSVEKKPKKKKFLGIVIAIVAVVVAGVVAAASLMGSMKGFVVETFGTDDEYLNYVESSELESGIEEISDYYGKLLTGLQKDKAATNASLKLNVGDSAISMLESALASSGGNIDLDWFKNVSFDFNYNYDLKSQYVGQVLAAINLNDKKLVDLDCILDFANGEGFVGLLPLNEKYLNVKFGDADEFKSAIELYFDEGLYDALPTEEEFAAILTKYADIVLANLPSAEKSEAVVKIGEISEELKTLKVTIYEKDARELVLAVLKAAKEDEQIKTCIDDVAKYLNEKGVVDNVDAYNMFIETVDEAINSLETMEIADGGEALVITNYVNSKHEVVGCAISFDNDDVLSYAVVRNGQSFAFEMKGADVAVSGSGTEKNDVVNGEFAVKVEDIDVCSLYLTDCKLNTEYPSGKIRVKPSSSLFAELDVDASVSTVVAAMNPMLELDFETSKNASNVSVNLLSGENLFVGFTLSAKEASVAEISKPDSSKVCAQENAMEWVSGMDIEGLLAKLKEAGVPSELVDALSSSMGI